MPRWVIWWLFPLDVCSSSISVVEILTVLGPHTFSNPFDEEAKFINTYTPSFYINYFKLLAKMNEEGKPMNPEANKKAMVWNASLQNRAHS